MNISRIVGLRVEILLQITFLLASALLLVGFLLLRVFEQEILTERIERITDQVENYSRLIYQARIERSHPEWIFREIQGNLLLEEWGQVNHELLPIARTSDFLFQNSELKLVQSSLESFIKVYFPSQLWKSDEQDFVRVTVPMIEDGRFSGAFQARFSLMDIRQRTLSARNLMVFYVCGYGILLIAFGYYLLTRTLVLPVRRLLHATHDITAGNLEPLVAFEGPREIAELAGSFNRMTEALKESRKETEAHIQSLRTMNEELHRTRDELIRTEKMASTGVLAAGMAHEMGNPLGAVVGYLEFLKSEPLRERDGEILSRALAETGRMDRLLRDLLDYAAPTVLETEPVDPYAVLGEAAGILVRQEAFAELKLAFETPSSFPKVLFTRHRLLQVFINLLLNARDASLPSSTIRLSGGEEGGFVWVTIVDEGCGMSPEIISRIFDPFFTTKPPGKGRGLGLSFCQRMAEENGGRLEVRSRPGKGSEFTVWMKKAESGI